MGILGADISLTQPGFAVLDSETEALLITSQKLTIKGPERWQSILENFKHIIDAHIIEFVVFEGYSFGSKFNREVLAEIGGLLRYHCFRRSIPFGSIPPTTLKKLFTGKGRAEKKDMMKAAYDRGFLCSNDNQADAVALAWAGHKNGFSALKDGWRPGNKQKDFWGL